MFEEVCFLFSDHMDSDSLATGVLVCSSSKFDAESRLQPGLLVRIGRADPPKGSTPRWQSSYLELLLVCHPDLRRTVRLTVNEAFYQQLAMRCHLDPLDLQETIGYVRHHVKVAGYTTGQLFTDDAVTRIFE